MDDAVAAVNVPERRLSFAFAKRHGVLVKRFVDGVAECAYRADTSPMAQSLRDLDDQARERAQRFDEANLAQVQTMQLAAKALEESQRARAESAEDRQRLLDALQQCRP